MFKKEDSIFSTDKSNTVIGKETFFKGIINGGKDIVCIDGRVEGNITNQNDVVVGKSGNVSAEIKANNITIAGRFEGTIEASGKLEIKSTGNAVGTFIANAFIIEDGANLSGNLDMKDKEHSGKPYEQGEKSINAPETTLQTTSKT